MSSNEIKIYLDRNQCSDFDIEYFDSCSTSLPADTILHSKAAEYDRFHRETLEPLGKSVISLERTGKEHCLKENDDHWDSPGWYRIIDSYISMS